MERHRIYDIAFSRIYPSYIAKAEKKSRTKAEVDEIIRWLTGRSQSQLEDAIRSETTLEDFYTKAPKLNPMRRNITGVIFTESRTRLKTSFVQ